MGETELVEFGVSSDDLFIDPSFAVVGRPWGGAGADGLVESGVGADGELAFADESTEGARDVELVEGDDCAGVGLIPVNGAVCGIGHGKESV